MSGAKVLFLIVNYGSYPALSRYLGSLSRQRCRSLARTIVVDNTECGRAREVTVRERDEVQVLVPASNLGYFGGAAWALRPLLSAGECPEWIIVSNADVVIEDCRFVECLTGMDVPRDCALLAPSIISMATGRNQNPHLMRRPSSSTMHFYRRVFRYYPLFLAYSTAALVKEFVTAQVARATVSNASLARMPIYAPHGSCVLIARRYFEMGGSLDYKMFLFNEEIFLAEEVRRLGLSVYFEPALRVVHREHVSTGLLRSRRMAKYFADAAEYSACTWFAQSEPGVQLDC